MAKIFTWLFLILSTYIFMVYKFQNVSSAIPLRNQHMNKIDRRNAPPRRSNTNSEMIFNDFLVLDDEDFEPNSKRFDDYGHMRFGKRGEDQFDDYGHMRFGRSI